MSKLGIFIRESRENLELTRKQFVNAMPEETRITDSTLGQIERGMIKRPPDIRLKGFAKVLRTSVSVLKKLMVCTTMGMIVLSSLWPKEAEAIEALRYYEPSEGYHLAFSGGKDSVVIKALAKKAEVKHRSFMSMTTLDPPELIRFIKKEYTDVIFLRPKYSMFKLIAEKKHSLPTRGSKFCCEFLKEYAGAGELVVTGIRWEESNRRKVRKRFEIDTRSNMRGKMYLHPIIDWKTWEVWEYIDHYGLTYPKFHYDMGYSRLGCIGCPASERHKRIAELERYPRFKAMYLKAIKKMMKATNKKGESYAAAKHFKNENEAMEWWLSDMSIEEWKKERDILLVQKQLKFFE